MVKHAAEMQRKFLAAALDARDIDELEEVSAACFAEEAAFVAAFLKQVNGKKLSIPAKHISAATWRKKMRSWP